VSSLKQILKQAQDQGLLHVAHPTRCNTQQTVKAVQHNQATPVQRSTSMPGNDGHLERNALRNTCATPVSNPVQQPAIKDRVNVAQETGHRIWRVTRAGQAFAVMVGAPCDYQEAIEHARFHWHDCDVEPHTPGKSN